MNCKDFQELIADALGGEIGAADSNLLDRHVAVCEACRSEYEKARRVVQTMRSLASAPNVAVLRTGDQLILQPIDATRARRFQRANVWLRYAACVFVAFVAGYFAATGRTIDGGATVAVEKPIEAARATGQGASLESAIVSIHKRHPHGSPLAKCLLAMAAPGDRKTP